MLDTVGQTDRDGWEYEASEVWCGSRRPRRLPEVVPNVAGGSRQQPAQRAGGGKSVGVRCALSPIATTRREIR
jgi:hypothetical protein